MLQGLPDFAASLDPASVPGTVFGGFERPDRAVVLPSRIGLERQLDGSPALLVTLLRRDGQDTGGRLEVGFAVEADLAGVGARLAAAEMPTRPVNAELAGGVLEVTARIGTAAANALFDPLALEPDVLTRARVVTELSPAAATLAARLAADATLPVSAVLRVWVRGVAPRLPLAVVLDPRQVAEHLAQRFGSVAVLDPDDLADALDALLTDPAITVEGDPGVIEPALRARVLRLRLGERIAVLQLSAVERYRLRPVAEVPSGRERVDLAAPTAVTLHRVLTLDPFAIARAMAGGQAGLVRRIDVPPLPVGRASVSVMANLPEPVAGLLALFADLRFPPTPQRPQSVTAGVALDLPERTATATFLLAPGERPAGEVRLRALVDSVQGPREFDGPWRSAAAEQLLLGPDAFPVPLTVLRASPGLLGVAVVEVRRLGATAPIARLDPGGPTVALPRVPGDDLLHVLVVPLGPGRPVELPLEQARRIDLDPATLPGFGAHRATLTARLSPGDAPVRVDWCPEGSTGPPASVQLTGTRPSTTIGWVATSPFQPGIIWGVAHGGVVDSWSEPVPPKEGLVIEVTDGGHPATDPPVVVDGVELNRDPADPAVWTYLPPGPLLELRTDGRPAIELVEAGDVAFLQLTTRIDRLEQARATLLAGLPASAGAQAVRALPVVVRRVALQLAKAGGTWVDVAAGGSSGIPPWTTALSTMLTAEQLAALRAALGGERGRLRLLGELEIPGRAAQVHSGTSSDGLTATTPNGHVEVTVTTRTASSPPQRRRIVEQTHDLADLIAIP
ncbi:MAG: hypothetical protein ACRDTG_13890 [Pseudonocardiaceae bacterium]